MTEQKKFIENIKNFFLNRNEIYVLRKILDGEYDFSKLSNKLKNNKEFMFQAIHNQDIAYRLKTDNGDIAEVEDSIIKYASNRLKNDKDIVTNAIKINPDALQFASKKLQDDKEIVKKAVFNYNTVALKFASDRLKNDKEIVEIAITMNPEILKFASDELKNNKEVILKAIKADGMALEFVSDRLKNDKDVVLTAVKNNGYGIQYASDKLKNDKDVVIEALKENKMSFAYIGKEIKEKYFPKEKNYSTESIEFQLTRPSERLEKGLENTIKSSLEKEEANLWDKSDSMDNSIDKNDPWAEKLQNDKSYDLER